MDELLALLCCPQCKGERLQLSQSAAPADAVGALGEPCDREIRCQDCGSAYPVANDDIPIMWTPAIRSYLQSKDAGESALAANIYTYDNISADYMNFTRQQSAVGQRIGAAVDRILADVDAAADRALYHLDFGCGPGHVLKWLSHLGMRQVGLDVSLANLRNARRATGALVVLGDAASMPFRQGVFTVVTESSALHHIEDWRGCLREACRVCSPDGGIVIDSEPSKNQMDWSWLARAVFELRWPVYKMLSYVDSRKYIFRDSKKAKLNYWLAEIHHQPGRGFPVEEVADLFASHGFEPQIVLGPTTDLRSAARPNKKQIALHLLSGHNPWNPKYGAFIAIARGGARRPDSGNRLRSDAAA